MTFRNVPVHWSASYDIARLLCNMQCTTFLSVCGFSAYCTHLFVTLPGKSLSPLVNVHLDVPPQVQRRLPQVALASTPCPKIALGHVQNLQKVSPVGRDLFDLVNPLGRIFQQLLDDWTCLAARPTH